MAVEPFFAALEVGVGLANEGPEGWGVVAVAEMAEFVDYGVFEYWLVGGDESPV